MSKRSTVTELWGIRLVQRILSGLLILSASDFARSEVVVAVSNQVGRPGSSVEVPISMSADEAVFGLQFAIHVEPDAATDLSPVALVPTESSLVVRTHPESPERYRFLIYSRGTEPIPQGDIASIRLTVPSETASVAIPVSISELEGGLGVAGQGGIQGRGGEVRINFVPEEVKLSGQVRYYSTEMPLESVSVVGFTPEGEFSTRSDPDGIFLLSVPSEQSVELGVQGSPSDEPNRGVTSLDLFLTRRHILGLAPFDSAAQQIAADVDRQGEVGALDLLLMRRVILGLASEYVQGEPLFRYFPAEQFRDELLNPWEFVSTRSFESLTDDLNEQDYLGIKIGDVDGDWISPESDSMNREAMVARSMNQGLQLRLSERPNLDGLSRRFAISAENFSAVSSLQFSLNWNSEEWQFRELVAVDLAEVGEFEWQTNEALLRDGRMGVVWTDTYESGFHFRDSVIAELILEPLVPSAHRPRLSNVPTFAFASKNDRPIEVRLSDSSAFVGPTLQIRFLDDANGSGRVAIEFSSQLDRLYELEVTDRLESLQWMRVGEKRGTGGVIRFLEEVDSARDRFYRVRPRDLDGEGSGTLTE